MILRCPTVTEIQFGRYSDWLPLYINNEELASYEDVRHFEKAVTRFTAARWSSDYQEMAHCFYAGDDAIITTITFAHQSAYPLAARDWHWLEKERLAECRAEPFACQFVY